MIDELTQSVNHIYGFKVIDGQTHSPKIDFPQFVRDRLNFFIKYTEDGMTFIGCLEAVLGHDEEECKRDFELGSYEEWMPVTDEFKAWRDTYLPRDREIAVAILYGFEGCYDGEVTDPNQVKLFESED